MILRGYLYVWLYSSFFVCSWGIGARGCVFLRVYVGVFACVRVCLIVFIVLFCVFDRFFFVKFYVF